MTKQEREKVLSAYLKIKHIADWDNKNLLKRQEYEIDDALSLLNEILSKDNNDTDTSFEVYALSVYGSDVVVKDTLDEAVECAEKWSLSTFDVDSDIVVEKVERSIVKHFRHGCELG